jgi:hypothetical protein
MCWTQKLEIFALDFQPVSDCWLYWDWEGLGGSFKTSKKEAGGDDGADQDNGDEDLTEVNINIFRLNQHKIIIYRFHARKQVLETMMKANVGNNPGSCIDKLQIPRNMQQYLKNPIY